MERKRLKAHQKHQQACKADESFRESFISVMIVSRKRKAHKYTVATKDAYSHFIEEGPEKVVDGARLPSILRFASCLSSFVTFSSFLGMSGVYCGCPGE